MAEAPSKQLKLTEKAVAKTTASRKKKVAKKANTPKTPEKSIDLLRQLFVPKPPFVADDGTIDSGAEEEQNDIFTRVLEAVQEKTLKVAVSFGVRCAVGQTTPDNSTDDGGSQIFSMLLLCATARLQTLIRGGLTAIHTGEAALEDMRIVERSVSECYVVMHLSKWKWESDSPEKEIDILVDIVKEGGQHVLTVCFFDER